VIELPQILYCESLCGQMCKIVLLVPVATFQNDRKVRVSPIWRRPLSSGQLQLQGGLMPASEVIAQV
jgi:hypothetical protein